MTQDHVNVPSSTASMREELLIAGKSNKETQVKPKRETWAAPRYAVYISSPEGKNDGFCCLSSMAVNALRPPFEQ